MIEQEAKTCLMYQKLKHFVNLFFTMEMTHVVTFTVDKILDKADLAQSFCHKFVQICLQNEKWKILLSNPGCESSAEKGNHTGYSFSLNQKYKTIRAQVVYR